MRWQVPLSSTTALLLLASCADQPTQPLLRAEKELAKPAASASGLSPSESLLTLTVIDPIGDNTGDIDVIRMEMDFNPLSGDYEIRLEAHPASPFLAVFRVNINLFNVNADDPTEFSDVVNDFDLALATTTLTLSGGSTLLTGWEEGDNVHTNSLCGLGPDPRFYCSTFDVPNPPDVTLFRSSVGSGGFLTNEDVIAFSDYAKTAVVEALTAQFRTERIIADVQRLVAEGVLTEDQGNGLLDKLNSVIVKIDAGKTRPAINQLKAFINQCNGLVPNHMTPAQGQGLIDQAEAAIVQLSS